MVKHGPIAGFEDVIFGKLEGEGFFERVFEDGLSFLGVDFQNFILPKSGAESALGLS